MGRAAEKGGDDPLLPPAPDPTGPPGRGPRGPAPASSPAAGAAGPRSAHDKHDEPHDPESPTPATQRNLVGEAGKRAEGDGRGRGGTRALSFRSGGWKFLPHKEGATFPTGRCPPRAPRVSRAACSGCGTASASAPCHGTTRAGTCASASPRREPGDPRARPLREGRASLPPRVSMEPSSDFGAGFTGEHRKRPSSNLDLSPAEAGALLAPGLLSTASAPFPALTSPARTCVSVAAACADPSTENHSALRSFILELYWN